MDLSFHTASSAGWLSFPINPLRICSDFPFLKEAVNLVQDLHYDLILNVCQRKPSLYIGHILVYWSLGLLHMKFERTFQP